MRINRFYLKGFEIDQKEISEESKCVFNISPIFIRYINIIL